MKALAVLLAASAGLYGAAYDNSDIHPGGLFNDSVTYTMGAGANGILLVWKTVGDATKCGSSVPTYNGVSMTLVSGSCVSVPFANAVALWCLAGPATGANTLFTNYTTGLTESYNLPIAVTSYTGVYQSCTSLDAVITATASPAGGTFTLTAPSLHTGSWLMAMVGTNSSAPAAGSGTTLRQSLGGLNTNMGVFDSNGAPGTGSQSLNAATSDYSAGIMVGLCPDTAVSCGTPPPAQCSSIATHNWSDAAAWACVNTAHTIPGDGDIVSITGGFTVTINQDDASALTGLNGISITGGSSLITDGLSHTIYMQPGTGISVCSGTFDTSAGTSYATRLIVKAADGTTPTWINHVSSCSGEGASVLNLQWLEIDNCGNSTATQGCLYWDADVTPTVNHVLLTNTYGGIIDNFQTGPISNVTMTGRSGDYGIKRFGFVSPSAGTSCGDITGVTDVGRTITAISPPALGSLFNSTYTCNGMTYSGNAMYSSAVTLDYRGIDTVFVGTANGTQSAPGAVSANACSCNGIGGAQGQSGVVSVLSGNVIDFGSVGLGSFTALDHNYITQSSLNALQQGCFVGLGTAGVSLNGDMCVLASGNANVGALIITSGGTTASFTAVNLSFYMGNDSGGTGTGISPGEGGAGSPYAVVSTSIKNSMFLNSDYGISNGATNSFLTTCASGVGVCGNLTFGNSVSDYNPATVQGNNFDNGVTPHPSATYGDMTFDPHVIDTARTQAAFDRAMGGPGTLANLYNALADRWCGLCGSFSYTGAYTRLGAANIIPVMQAWLAAGLKPRIISLRKSGDGGAQVGSQVPYLTGGAVQ